MDEFESSHMEALKELGAYTWMRYVHDVFSVIRDETCSQNILDYLNRQHNNIKFTIEKENKITFLHSKTLKSQEKRLTLLNQSTTSQHSQT